MTPFERAATMLALFTSRRLWILLCYDDDLDQCFLAPVGEAFQSLGCPYKTHEGQASRTRRCSLLTSRPVSSSRLHLHHEDLNNLGHAGLIISLSLHCSRCLHLLQPYPHRLPPRSHLHLCPQAGRYFILHPLLLPRFPRPARLPLSEHCQLEAHLQRLLPARTTPRHRFPASRRNQWLLCSDAEISR